MAEEPFLESGMFTKIFTFGSDGLIDFSGFFLGLNDIGRKNGGLVEETMLDVSKYEGVFVYEFLILKFLKSVLFDDTDEAIFGPDALLRDIFRLIASRRSFFNSSLGLCMFTELFVVTSN